MSERENKKNIETAVEQPKKLQTDLRNTKDIKESAVKVDRYLDKLMVKLDSPPVKRHPPPVDVPVEADTPSADDEVFQKPVNSETESSTCMAESETQSNENTVERSESAVVNLSSDVVSVNNERNCEIGNFSPEVIVKTDESGADVESCLPAQVKDGNDNISESVVPDETEHQMNGKTKKSLELKDESHQGKPPSPSDVHLKVIHNRENSASSILEETLESAKTIASIYSVEGPARSATGEDSLCTASEMRRYSLAKHVLRKRPKAETEISTTRKTETTGELDESLSTPERASNPSIEASLPVENETDMDESGNRSAGSTSSNGSRRSSGIISPKIEALEEQKVNFHINL